MSAVSRLAGMSANVLAAEPITAMLFLACENLPKPLIQERINAMETSLARNLKWINGTKFTANVPRAGFFSHI